MCYTSFVASEFDGGLAVCKDVSGPGIGVVVCCSDGGCDLQGSLAVLLGIGGAVLCAAGLCRLQCCS